MPGFFAGKTVVLGVTGSIAAYKACELASRLVEQGARVLTALTPAALEFVQPATFEAITRQRAITGLFDPVPQPEIEHIAVAKQADLFLVAPATANILAKAAVGLADDWLSTTLLATRAPILFAPAMNTMMYEHPATQANIETLRGRGCHFVGPDAGALACGDTGLGRLAAIPNILEAAAILLHTEKDLAGRHVLITSGANHEPIDPVRFIGNRSSGKMGRAIALEALSRGARVTVVAGISEVPLPRAVELVRAETAKAMFEAVQTRWPQADIFIGAAAVADYHVAHPTPEKHKRGEANLELALVPNPDIAAWVGTHKRPDQISVCFAAETQTPIENAIAKRTEKNADLVVVNQVGGTECAFGAETTSAAILNATATSGELQRLTKESLATEILNKISALLQTSIAPPQQ